MIIDYSSSNIVEGATIFPEWDFVDDPKPDPLVNTIVLLAGSAGNANVTGDVDIPE
jgi:hypothetical protein